MARLLVRTTDRPGPRPLHRGDVIDVRPDDYDWRVEGASLSWPWHEGDATWDHYVVLDCPRVSVWDAAYFLAVAMPDAPHTIDPTLPRTMASLDLDALPTDLSAFGLEELAAYRRRKPMHVPAGFGHSLTRFGP